MERGGEEKRSQTGKKKKGPSSRYLFLFSIPHHCRASLRARHGKRDGDGIVSTDFNPHGNRGLERMGGSGRKRSTLVSAPS